DKSVYSWIFLSFSRQLTLLLQVRKRGRKHRERAFLPTPDSDLCIGGRVKKCPQRVNIKMAPIGQIQVPKRPSTLRLCARGRGCCRRDVLRQSRLFTPWEWI